jgi:hypothetical protein
MMNEQLTGETARTRVRGSMYFFAAMMCCIRSDASFFHLRLPLFASASGPTVVSEK